MIIRCWILLGFSFLFLHLHATGNISKYINLKYSSFSFAAIFVFFFFFLIQGYFAWKEGADDEEYDEICGCGMDHANEEKSWKERISYPIFILPILTALFLPIATLDSNIVAAKGFNFAAYDDTDPYGIHQFLEPDTSVFYGQEGFDEIMKEMMDQYANKDRIILTDQDFLLGMETIYKKPGYFMGKTIGFKGFTYIDKETGNVFLFRFGMIHCVADSGVFGMLLELPKDVEFQNDEWIEVEGTMDSIFYQPFKKTIPILKVENIEKIAKPEDPYVYRAY
ncbi:TIGR03943 family putative permease subunit [Sporosarcina limicola]|uniref:Membrane protein n=1 Tax=Sporosarcina limicola TaxID=34101 RepID=A0A927MLF6_9BACL|nr:TIGR03943 family protein [Sporosarcina limicola]MBE1555292.1 putative membrane protein [Sporosarcina limicola]